MTDETQEREYSVTLYVECYAEVTVYADDEDGARDQAIDVVSPPDLHIDEVVVQQVREVGAAA